MATIRRSGKGWQALIRKKQYQGPKAKTFSSRSQALLWANAMASSLLEQGVLAIISFLNERFPLLISQ